MKKTILTLAVVGMITGSIFTSCQSSAKKVENAEENLQNAKDNVSEAREVLNQTLIDSITQFKQESDAEIRSNDKTISDLKAKIKTMKMKTKIEYENKISEIEQKNKELKIELDEYKDIEQVKWNSFKNEFNHDMKELGKSIKNLTVNNTK